MELTGASTPLAAASGSGELISKPLYNEVNFSEVHRRPTKFLRKSYRQKHCKHEPKGKKDKMKGSGRIPESLLARNRLERQLRRKNMTRGE
jgi:hypothetical protein